MYYYRSLSMLNVNKFYLQLCKYKIQSIVYYILLLHLTGLLLTFAGQKQCGFITLIFFLFHFPTHFHFLHSTYFGFFFLFFLLKRENLSIFKNLS